MPYVPFLFDRKISLNLFLGEGGGLFERKSPINEYRDDGDNLKDFDLCTKHISKDKGKMKTCIKGKVMDIISGKKIKRYE